MAYCVNQVIVQPEGSSPITALAIDSTNTPPTCPGGFVLYSNTDYSNATSIDFASLGIDSSSVSLSLAFGIGAIISLWIGGFILSLVLGIIRKA